MESAAYSPILADIEEKQKTLTSVEETPSFFSLGLGTRIVDVTLSGDWNRVFEYLASPQTDTSVLLKIDRVLDNLESIDINIPDRAEMMVYLFKHNDMLDLVSDVCHWTRACFPTNTQLSLEIYHDPEIEDAYITLYVRQEEYDRDILKGIKVILVGYSELIKGKSGWFLVTTDFNPPK